MTETPQAWIPPKSSFAQRLLRPGWSDAEIAFPALRRARGPSDADQSDDAQAALDPPDGDWSETARARFADALIVVEVVLRDATDPLDGLTVLEPFVKARSANRIDCLHEPSGAVFECDVEGEGDYRIRYCAVRWPESSSKQATDFAAFFKSWRSAAMGRLNASPVPNEDLTPNVVNPRAFAWCLGTKDRMQITLETTNRGPSLSATRAWAERREVCT